MESLPRTATFVVRVSEGEARELTGTVERALTGERHPFRGAEALASLIAQLAGRPTTDPPARGGH